MTVVGLVAGLWAYSLVIKDASIIDPFWGVGFVVIAIVCYWRVPPSVGSRASLMLALTAIWGLRLGGYLTWRKSKHGEDRRYTAMREHHGERFWWVSLFTVFLFQALLMTIISIPVQFGIHESGNLIWLDAVGVTLWLIGMSFETIGDFQLARFKADPENRGRVLDTGLWRYTRHPNYFGDFCVWWGLYAIALAAGGWWTVFGPLTISFLLLKVSGVTMLEETITERRPEYAQYIQTTNAFFPGPPRRE